MTAIMRSMLVMVLLVLLVGCESEVDRSKRLLSGFADTTARSVSDLKTHLEKDRLRNATILREYARIVGAQRPEMSAVVEALAEDASSNGTQYRSLVARLDAARNQLEALSTTQQGQLLAAELESINTAAQPANYNMMLTDPINVLADMSNGELARVQDLSQQAAAAAGENTIGKELVGNPNYGQWKQDSSGGTFWEWYGKYALISSLMGGYRYDYGGWSRNRYASYYHDVGRDYYSSPGQRSRSQQTEARVKKQFTQQGRRFESPYAKTRARTTRATRVASSGGFRSTYSQNVRSSSSGSRSSAYSSRGGSSSRSWGSGGK